MAKKEPTQEIAIRSVRFNGRSIDCKWMQGDDAYSVTFHDKPLPSFERALAALAEHACELCEFPTKDADKITATGITLRPLGTDNSQGLITAKKKIRKGKRVFNITTPLLALWPAKKDEDPVDCMEEETAKAISKFEAEARKYIRNGPNDRAQGKLDFGDEEDSKPENDGKQKEMEFPAVKDPEVAGT